MKIAMTSLALAIGLAGCGLLEAEAQSKQLCVQQTNLADIPAAPPVSAPWTPTVTLQLDLGAAIPDLSKKGTELDIRPDAITLGSASGDVSFAGIETATITVLPPSGRTDLPPVVFRYERASPPPQRVFTIAARPTSPANLGDYLEGNALRIGVSFTGTAPQRAWTATLELCGDTRVRVNYWDRITS